MCLLVQPGGEGAAWPRREVLSLNIPKPFLWERRYSGEQWTTVLKLEEVDICKKTNFINQCFLQME